MDIQHLLQTYVDKSVNYMGKRWALFGAVLCLFMIRLMQTGGYRLVTYALALYLLHGFIGFCTPLDREIPDPFDLEEVEAPSEETAVKRSGDETKPFLRKLPEFEYWMLSTRAVIYAFFSTFFPVLDIPVYAPILVIYFLILVYFTFLRIRKYMEKYKYNPFFNAKRIYRNLI